MISKFNLKQSSKGNATSNRLFGNLEGAFAWNGKIYDKLSGKSGVYLISVIGWERRISYPHGKSNIIYVGESEDIGKRLYQHKFTGVNRNLKGYADACNLTVYYRKVQDASELKHYETQMILKFENRYGCIPMCNGQRPTEYTESFK